MILDGEWRVAFLKDQAPDVDFGTAPFPVPDDQADRYGAGYVTGNIMGISKGSKNPEAAWALIKYLTLNTGAIVKLANGIKNVPTTHAALASPDLQVDDAFKTFLDMFENPASQTSPVDRQRRGLPETSSSDFFAAVAAGQGRRPGRRAGEDAMKRSTRRCSSARRRSRSRRDHSHLTRTPVAPPVARRRRGNGRLVMLLMAPWAIGFLVFFVYPLIATVWYSFTRFDLLSPPEFVGLRNYRYFLFDDPNVWKALRNTLWFVVFMVPARLVSALLHRPAADEDQAGPSFFRTVFYLPALAPPVAATIAFVFLFNPATGAVNTLLGSVRRRGAAVVQRPGAGQAGAAAARRCGAWATS